MARTKSAEPIMDYCISFRVFPEQRQELERLAGGKLRVSAYLRGLVGGAIAASRQGQHDSATESRAEAKK